jgi:hypothetical protein
MTDDEIDALLKSRDLYRDATLLLADERAELREEVERLRAALRAALRALAAPTVRMADDFHDKAK